MKIDALSRLERHAKRIAEIATVLGKYGLADLFGGFEYAWLRDRLKSADGQMLTGTVTTSPRRSTPAIRRPRTSTSRTSRAESSSITMGPLPRSRSRVVTCPEMTLPSAGMVRATS